MHAPSALLYAKRRESDEKKIENNEEVVVASLFHRETLSLGLFLPADMTTGRVHFISTLVMYKREHLQIELSPLSEFGCWDPVRNPLSHGIVR